MSRHRRRTAAPPSHDPSGDGAELPLLHPRLLAQLSQGHRERRPQNVAEDCLILSAGGLERFDSHRVDEMRKGLSAEVPVSGWPVPSRGRGRALHWKWLVLTACYLALAIGAGLTIGYVL
jgi:hypothetical protein